MSEKPPISTQPQVVQGYSNPAGYGGPDQYAMQQTAAAYQAPPGQAVVVQPMAYQPHPGATPQQMAGCPPGMEYLASLDKVSISQVMHLSEVLLGWERNNQYRICNTSDQQFMHAKEETDCCTRQMLGTMRPFHMDISNMQGQVLMQLDRPLRCQGCCCPCCLQEMEIFSPPGVKIGTVKEIWSCWVPRYEILDAADNPIYRIEGDCCYCKCCADVPFKVTRMDGSDAGEITKHWRGCEELCAHVNNFSVTYGPGENALNKTILLGATFLVDLMYFEYNKNNN